LKHIWILFIYLLPELPSMHVQTAEFAYKQHWLVKFRLEGVVYNAPAKNTTDDSYMWVQHLYMERLDEKLVTHELTLISLTWLDSTQ
jgi:hypothetical protein